MFWLLHIFFFVFEHLTLLTSFCHNKRQCNNFEERLCISDVYTASYKANLTSNTFRGKNPFAAARVVPTRWLVWSLRTVILLSRYASFYFLGPNSVWDQPCENPGGAAVGGADPFTASSAPCTISYFASRGRARKPLRFLGLQERVFCLHSEISPGLAARMPNEVVWGQTCVYLESNSQDSKDSGMPRPAQLQQLGFIHSNHQQQLGVWGSCVLLASNRCICGVFAYKGKRKWIQPIFKTLKTAWKLASGE